MPTHTTAIMFSVTPAIVLGCAERTYISVDSAQTVSLFESGKGVITGTVKEKHSPSNLPLRRRVRLYKKQDGRLMRETWSGYDGTYSFNLLPLQEYYVTSLDHTGLYNAVIQDSITPVEA